MATQLDISLAAPNTLKLTGELCLDTERGLRAAFDVLPGPIQLDLEEVTFMDSTGLRVIIERMMVAPVKMSASSSAVRKVFELVGIETTCDGQLLPPLD